MLLAIDIGNTSTAVGVFKKGDLVANWRLETKKESTADEMALLYQHFLEASKIDAGGIKGVAISNVVPSVQHAVTSMSVRHFGVEPLSVDSTNAGIEINYPNPEEIGADRLVNAVAAYEKFKTATIVIDFGTATTFDYIDGDGAYCGGAIAPGIAIANEALYRWTSKLPRVDIVRTKRMVAKSTVEAVQSGLFNGYVGLVEGVLKKMKDETGTSPSVIATGGLASLMVKDLGIEVDKFLTLEGLMIIYERNSLSS